MGQTGHPYSSQVKASVARRLKALGASPGKAWGRSAMDVKSSYPSTHAGTEREMTISGKSAPKRVDRYARGGRVKGKGNTTNIIIAHPGGGADGARPTPVPVPVPSGMPVGVPPRPVMPMAAAPPVAAPAGVPIPAGARPPGYKTGGAVKKLANGGFLKEDPGKTYSGFPHSPTTSVDDAVSAHKKGGAVKKAKWAAGGALQDKDFAGQISDKDATKAGLTIRGTKYEGSEGAGPQKDRFLGRSNTVRGVTPDEYKKGGAVKKAVGKWAKGGDVDESGEAALARAAAAKTMRSRRDTPDAFPVGGMGSVDNSQKPVKDREPAYYGRKKGGAVMKAGAGSGLGRLGKIAAARAVPSKTEL